MNANVVLNGAYKGKAILNPTGKPYIKVSLGKKLYLDRNTVEAYEVVTEDSAKSAASGVARGMIGGALLGPVGMLAGSLSAKTKKTVTVILQFKDGEKSLVEFHEVTYKDFIGKML